MATTNILNERQLTETTGFVFGPELVINGTFDNDGNWNINSGWNISDGRANIDTDNGTLNFTQSSVLVVGKKYRLSLNANITVGSVKFESGEGDDFIFTSNVDSHIFVADSTLAVFRRKEALTRGYIDNISIVEVLETPQSSSTVNNILNERQETETSITPIPEISSSIALNLQDLRTETETPTVQDLSGGRGTDSDETQSNITNLVDIRIIGSIIGELMNSLRERAQFFENEQATRNILTEFENCKHI